MKTKGILFSFIAILILSVSCGQNVDHDKEAIYYVTLTKVRINATKAVNSYMQAMSMANYEIVTHKHADSNDINQMNKSFQLAIIVLDSAIGELSVIEEIDPEINLKGKMLAYCNDSKALLQSDGPGIIGLFSSVNDGLTNEQRETYMKFNSKANKINPGEIAFDDMFVDFQNKHHITGEDLRKYRSLK